MRLAMPSQVLERARYLLRPILHFITHWSKELFVAAVLAVIAAIWLDHYNEHRRQDILNENRRAVAMIIASKGQTPIGQGSGVFVNHAGLVLTNYHVIKGADNILAKLPTGAYFQLHELKGANESADIAILQFRAADTPCVHRMGDSDSVTVGDKVVAIGAPLGLESSVSEGIVSDPKRSFRGIDFIQFTAAISPGSSGGGLFDALGALLGLTSASMASDTGEATAQNLNLAVPINLVKEVLEGKTNPLTEGTPEYYYSRGTIAANKHEFEHAIEDYKRAIELDPRYVDAYLEAGGAYYEMGQYDREVELKYRAVLAIKPDDKDALHDLAVLYIISGERAAASEVIQRLTAVNAGLGRKLALLLTHTRSLAGERLMRSLLDDSVTASFASFSRFSGHGFGQLPGATVHRLAAPWVGTDLGRAGACEARKASEAPFSSFSSFWRHPLAAQPTGKGSQPSWGGGVRSGPASVARTRPAARSVLGAGHSALQRFHFPARRTQWNTHLPPCALAAAVCTSSSLAPSQWQTRSTSPRSSRCTATAA